MSLDVEPITCPDCGSHYFTIKKVPSANTYYLLCLDCQNEGKETVKFITTELIVVSKEGYKNEPR